MVFSNHQILTLKQKQILAKIEKFYQTEGYFPSTRDLNQILNLKSSNTVFSHLQALVKKGFLKKNLKGKIIAITAQAHLFTKKSDQLITNQENTNYSSESNPLSQIVQQLHQAIQIPYFPQAIPAGFQAPAEDAGREMITVDQYVIKNPHNTFALKVKGNSMEKAGIMPGDLLLVEKRSDAKANQIIVAHLPSGFTVKRLIIEKGQQYLKAESSQDYQIKLEEGTEIWGIVIGIVRKY